MEESQLETLRKELEYWLQHEPVNNMGKLAKQTKIDSLKEQIKRIEQHDKNLNHPIMSNQSSITSTKEIIKLVGKVISNFDPTPTIVNEDFPLRWESNIFIQDYDFSENYLDLDPNDERSNGNYLKSVGTAIEINKEEDGSFEYWDGVFMIESHTWCSKLNNNEDFPSFSLINKKFKNTSELKKFLKKTYS